MVAVTVGLYSPGSQLRLGASCPPISLFGYMANGSICSGKIDRIPMSRTFLPEGLKSKIKDFGEFPMARFDPNLNLSRASTRFHVVSVKRNPSLHFGYA